MQQTLPAGGWGLLRIEHTTCGSIWAHKVSSRFWKWWWSWRFEVLARWHVATFVFPLPNYNQLIGSASHSSCQGCFQSPVGSVQLAFPIKNFSLMLRQWCLNQTGKAGCWPKIAQILFLEKSRQFLILVTVITNMFSPTRRCSVIVRFIQLIYLFIDIQRFMSHGVSFGPLIKHLCTLFSVYNYTMKSNGETGALTPRFDKICK